MPIQTLVFRGDEDERWTDNAGEPLDPDAYYWCPVIDDGNGIRGPYGLQIEAQEAAAWWYKHFGRGN